MASRCWGKDVHSALKYLWPGVSAYFSLESFFQHSVPESATAQDIFRGSRADGHSSQAAGPIHPAADRGSGSSARRALPSPDLLNYLREGSAPVTRISTAAFETDVAFQRAV